MLSAGGDGDCIQWRWWWWRPVESKAPCLGGDARPGDWSIISMIFTRRSWHGTRDRSRTTPTRVNIHLKLSPNYIYSFSSVLRFWLTIMSPMQWPLPMVGRTLKLCGVHYVIRHWKIEKFEVFSIHKLQSMTMRPCLLGAVWEVDQVLQQSCLLFHLHTVHWPGH